MCRCIKYLPFAVALCALPGAAAASDNNTPMTLAQAIEIAMEHNPTFKTSELAIQGATHRQRAAAADFLPKIGTSYIYQRLNEPPRIKAPAGTLYPEAISAVMGTQNRYQWDLHVVQPLFTGGELYWAHRLEKIGVDVARLKHQAARNELIHQVKAAYFAILKAQKLREIAHRAVEQIASHAKTARDFFEQEMMAKNDLLEAQVRLAQAQQDLVRAEQNVELARAAFNTVLHRDVNAAVEIADVCDEHQPVTDRAENQALALQRQPLIRAIDAGIRQAQTAVQLAYGTYFPKVYLLSSYARQGNQADVRGTPYGDPEFWQISVQADWTFWEWGKKSNVVGEQKVKLLEAQELRKEIVDTILLQVENAWLRCKENFKNIGVARTAIARAEENFRIYQNRFEQQMATTTDVLDAQTLLTQAHSNYHASRYDYCVSRSALELATGGPSD